MTIHDLAAIVFFFGAFVVLSFWLWAMIAISRVPPLWLVSPFSESAATQARILAAEKAELERMWKSQVAATEYLRKGDA